MKHHSSLLIRWAFAAGALLVAVGVYAVLAIRSGSLVPVIVRPYAGSNSLYAGSTFALDFPDLPPTFAERQADRSQKRLSGAISAAVRGENDPPRMTVFLPRDYEPGRKYPLLIFLSGGDGGHGGNPSVARKLTGETGFICANLPLFKADVSDYIVHDIDSRYAWPYYRTMLARLRSVVPNIDPDCRIIGGFSNGAHTIQGFIDLPDSEAARQFSAVFLVEGGRRLNKWSRLKDKPVLILYGTGGGRPAKIYRESAAADERVARSAGVRITMHEMPECGHAFPESEYPAVSAWLREQISAAKRR